MKKLFEEDFTGDQEYARNLLVIQSWYNGEMKRLNDQLAKKKNDAMIAFQKRAEAKKAQSAAASAQQPKAPAQQQNNQTGTVTTAGQPVAASGNPPAKTVESYPDILKINLVNEDNEMRISNRSDYYGHDMRNWYQKPENKVGYTEPAKSPRRKKMTSKVQNQIWDLESQLEDLQYELRDIQQKTQYSENMNMEIEEFFAELGHQASEILNSGAYPTDEAKAFALHAVGVRNPEEVINQYKVYYPDESEQDNLEDEKQRIEDEIEKIESQIDELRSMYESVNEGTFNTENADPYELQDLKDYLDAENISYFEEENGSVIDFDETELDREWQDRLEDMGMKEESDFGEIESEDTEDTEVDDILTVDDDDSTDDISDMDEKIDEDKVFYIKVSDDGSEFTGKIYKLFDEGDWRSKIVDGDSETFEKLNYDPDWDEVDIIAFLRENYDEAEIVSEEEFNDHVEEPEEEPESEEVEESWAAAARIAAPIVKKGVEAAAVKLGMNVADKLTGTKVEETDEEEPPKTHKIPTLDEFLKETE